MTGFKSKRQATQAKLDEDDDTQVYADTLLIVYQRGFADGKRAAQPEQEPCVGKDPRCPCQDGDACHYKDCGNTKALPVPVAQLEQEPVAWMYTSTLAGNQQYITRFQHDLTTYKADKVWPLYTTPPAAEPPAEWPLIKNILAEYGLDAIAFVAEWKAAQRKWQGLTEEEVSELSLSRRYLVREVEAKLKEKNHDL